MPTSQYCQPDPPKACHHRLKAVVEGTFVLRSGGWFWLDCKTPGQPWTRCPWCDGLLISPAKASDKLWQAVMDPDDEC